MTGFAPASAIRATTSGPLSDGITMSESTTSKRVVVPSRTASVESLADSRGRADAGVGYREQHAAALLPRLVRDANREHAPVGHRVARVDDEVDDHLLELSAVGDDACHRPVAHAAELDRLADQS